MADFRKWILALAIIALFAGLAGAQSNNPFTCNSVGANPPQIRSEGFTELVGDILITCQGGPDPVLGAPVQTVNITVYMNAPVTSRLLGTASVSGASEAVLLINDPGLTNGAEYGNTLPQIVCPTPLGGAGPGGGCGEVVGIATTPVPSPGGVYVPVEAVNTAAAGWNVFQGVVSGSAVTFYGVPILPPATVPGGGFTNPTSPLTLRITNVRINANLLAGGGTVPTNVVATLAVTGTNASAISSTNVVNVGVAGQSLFTNVYGAYSHSNAVTPLSVSTGLLQCLSYPQAPSTTPVALSTLRFSESASSGAVSQGSAFKVRGNAAQTIPGFNYFTESGLTVSALTGTPSGTGFSYTAGYADWGTRLKAVFTNVPSGVALWVSTTNLLASGASADLVPATAGPNTSFAALITGEISPDNVGGVTYAGNGSTANLPVVTQTGTATTSVAGATAGPFGIAPIAVVGGQAVAVWEVANSLPNTPENFDFEVFMTVTASPGTNVPPAPSAMNVALSYAPTATQGAFTLTSGQAASSTLGIPRFADTSTPVIGLTFAICQTALLYPYVQEVAGFDTGLSIANTSADPFKTPNQSGYCSIYWYGQIGVPATNPGYVGASGYQTVIPTSPIAPGTIQSFATSVVAPGFDGYVIAVCNFQFAHGFAFVSDLGAQKLAMGYLADILTDGFAYRVVNGALVLPGAETLGQ